MLTVEKILLSFKFHSIKKIPFAALILLLLFQLSGCLSVESKEYSFTLKKDKSGKGVIKFINLMSDKKDSLSTIESDYQDLLNNYIKGSKIEDDMQGLKNI